MYYKRTNVEIGAERGNTVTKNYRRVASIVLICLSALSAMQVSATGHLVPTVNFVASPTIASAGGGTVNSFTWSATNNPTSCTGSATKNGTGFTVTGWTGPRAISQSAPGFRILMSRGIQGTYVFMMTCRNASGVSALSSLTAVTAGPTGGPTTAVGCPGNRPPSYGLTRQTTMRNNQATMVGNGEFAHGAIMDTTQFSVIHGPWPVRTGGATLAVSNGKFLALEFNTGTVSFAKYGGTASVPKRFGVLETDAPGTYAGSGPILFAISECPGDFQRLADNNNVNCKVGLGSSQFPWAVGVPGVRSLSCNLNENTRYYLNIASVDYFTGRPNCRTPMTGSNPGACHFLVIGR